MMGLLRKELIVIILFAIIYMPLLCSYTTLDDYHRWMLICFLVTANFVYGVTYDD